MPLVSVAGITKADEMDDSVTRTSAPGAGERKKSSVSVAGTVEGGESDVGVDGMRFKRQFFVENGMAML